MSTLSGLMASLKRALGRPLASPESDPARWFNSLGALPNPDPILREMGRAEQIYYSIASDPHVLGDIRSIRGNFRSQQFRVVAGDADDSKAAAARDLCERWLQRTMPNPLADWLEVFWQMSSAFMTGYRPHELIWALQDGKYLPQQVVDRPGRRFRFDAHGAPLLVSTGNMLGAPIDDPYCFVISRHMADAVNPYGVSVLSACFWAWTFKTGGWRYFVKYCERHGLPWPVGRYPLNTDPKEIGQLEAALANMMEAGYVVAAEGTGLELLTPSGSGSLLPQQALIDLANREMSKALTGQAMVAELQGAGARAASETAFKRQEAIDDSVRDIAVQSMGTVFRWITLFNFGDGVAPPALEFYKAEAAGKERAETYEIARKSGARPSRKAMLEELRIPEAENDADALVAPTPLPAGPKPAGQLAPPAGVQPGTNPDPDEEPAEQSTAFHRMRGLAGFSFARAAGMTEDEAVALAAEAADQALEDHAIAPIARMLAQYEAEGRTLDEFSTDLAQLVGRLDDEGLREVLDRALTYSLLRGAATNVD